MHIGSLFCFLIVSLSLIGPSQPMEVGAEANTSAFLKTIDHYQKLLHTEIDFNTRMLSSIRDVVTDPATTVEDLQRFIRQFPIGYSLYSKAPPLNAQISDLIVVHQNDLIFAHYLNLAFQDIVACLERGIHTLESPAFKDHLKEIIRNIAWQNELTCIEVNKSIMACLSAHFDVLSITLSDRSRMIVDTIPESEDPKLRPATTLLYRLKDDRLPRSYYLSNDLWQRINLVVDEDSAYFDHQQQYLFFYSCLERDLLPFTHRFPKNFFQHLNRESFEETLGNNVLKFARLKMPQKEKEFDMHDEENYSVSSTAVERYFLSENEIREFLQQTYNRLESKLDAGIIDSLTDDSFLPDHVKRFTARQQKHTKRILLKQQEKRRERNQRASAKTEVTKPLPVAALSPHHPQRVEKEEPIAVKAQTSAPLSPPMKERAHLYKLIPTKTKETPMSMPDFSKKGQRFYEAIFGKGGKNVYKKHFNQFLKDIGGQKYKMTPQGLKEIDLQDKAVEIHYRIPNLTSQQREAFDFKIHQPHANYPFPRHTLYHFLRPQLEEAGYGGS